MNILHEMTSLTSPGVPLKNESIKRSLDFDKCVLCQKVKATKVRKNLLVQTFTPCVRLLISK